MLLFNLLILFLVVVLSFLFKLGEVNNYDTQLIFILLSFVVLVMYKTLNNIYNDKEKKAGLRKKLESFLMDENKLNEFINDTLTNTEKIRILENELENYRKAYGTDSILNNNLDVKIADLNNAISKLNDSYLADMERANPAGLGPQLSVSGSSEAPILKVQNGDESPTTIDDAKLQEIISQFITNLAGKEFTYSM